ncbi:MAG: hypothetical protein VX834_07955, partial [Myxococcota bacterium]|nr:hypothetical protein [Myxococcota bacterium]
MRIMMRSKALMVAAVLLLALGACTEENREIEMGTALAGETCKQYSDCFCGTTDAGDPLCLSCEDDGSGTKSCVAIQAAEEIRGQACNNHDQCGDLFCGQQGVCTPNQGSAAGQTCGLTVDCQVGLVCNGYCGVCTEVDGDDGTCPRFVIPGTTSETFEGTADLGEECLTPLSCRRPYICGPDKICAKLPALAMANCSQSADEQGAFRAYWELPPEDIFDDGAQYASDFEFYRLPFPNDIRRIGTQISLAGHFVPSEILGTDVQSSYVEAAEKDAGGFAPNAPIFFRFSDYVMEQSVCLSPGSVYPETLEDFPENMFDSILAGETQTEAEAPQFCTAEGAQPSVGLVDLTTGEHVPVQMAMTRSAGAYICHNSIAIGALDGQPLKHGHTYAAYVTTALEDIRGDNPIWDWDFARLMCDSGGNTDDTADDCGEKWAP